MEFVPRKPSGLTPNPAFDYVVSAKTVSMAAIQNHQMLPRFRSLDSPAALSQTSPHYSTEILLKGRIRGPFHEAISTKKCRKILHIRRKRHATNTIVRVNSNSRIMDVGSDCDDSSAIPSASASQDQTLLHDRNWLSAFHRFSRPHTVIGTILGVTSVSLLALQNPADLSPAFLRGLAQAVIPSLLMNVYIVGLNQIYDIDIDKVNKPYLPLVSGEFSITMGVTIILAAALLSVGIGVLVGSRALLVSLLVSMVLGTGYSVDAPLLRWKQSAPAAAFCVFAVRALVVQVGFYYHMQEFVLGRAPQPLTRPFLFATAFMAFFSLVIALAKDLPDVEGDEAHNIRSFSVRLGTGRVFWSCVWLIQGAYVVAMAVGATSPTVVTRAAMVFGHAVLSLLLWVKAKATDLKTKASIVSFYMFIWRLFYAEYLIIPFVR